MGKKNINKQKNHISTEVQYQISDIFRKEIVFLSIKVFVSML